MLRRARPQREFIETREFDVDTRRKLEGLGFTMVGPAEAFADVRPRITEPEVLSYEEGPLEITRVRTYRLIYPPLYRTESVFSHTCTKYRDPKIAFSIIPTKATNVYFHIWGLWFDGNIETRLSNTGKDGEEGTHEMRWPKWRILGCPTDENDYSWEVLKDSAKLKDNSFANLFYENSSNAYLSNISQKIGDAPPAGKSSATGYFKTSGLGDFFWTLVSILLTGTVTTRNGFDVTVHYDWLGDTYEAKQHIDITAPLPIEGGVSIGW